MSALEAKYARKGKTGPLSPERSALVARWQYLPAWVIHKWYGAARLRDQDWDAAVAAGEDGLIRAAQLFDESAGTKFVTYAVGWVRQSVQRWLEKRDKLRREKTVSSMSSAEEIAEHGEWGGLLEPEDHRTRREFERESLREELDLKLRKVTARERLILEMRHRDGMTLGEIAADLGLSKNRIAQIHDTAMWRLGVYERPALWRLRKRFQRPTG